MPVAQPTRPVSQSTRQKPAISFAVDVHQHSVIGSSEMPVLSQSTYQKPIPSVTVDVHQHSVTSCNTPA